MKSAIWRPLLLVCLVAGCTSKSPEVPATPDGAAAAIISGMADDKPVVLWTALPERYQKDVKGLISDFAGKMDKDIWNKTFVVLNKVVRVAKEKRDYILGSPMLAAGPLAEKRGAMESNWDSVVEALQTLTDSDIKTHDGVKGLDPEAFLNDTAAKLSRNIKKLAALDPSDKLRIAVDQIKSSKVTLVKSDGNVATIRVETPGKPSQEHPMKKVDGKWLPEEIVDGWDDGVRQLKQQIADHHITADQKAGILDAIGAADKALDELLAANSQEEFNTAVGSVMGNLMAFTPVGAGPEPDFRALQALESAGDFDAGSFEVADPASVDEGDLPSGLERDDREFQFAPAPDTEEMPEESEDAPEDPEAASGASEEEEEEAVETGNEA